jgi:hypothetical protein
MPAEPARPSIERDIAAALVVAAVTVLVYWPAFVTGFTADDFFILARVKALDGLAHPLSYFGFGFFDYYRPLAFLSHALDWTIWGLNPVGFHLTSVVLHALNAVLVFVIARRLVGQAALVAMLLFAVHPASHEAVYWVAARFDLLATAFVLLAIVLLWSDRPLAVAGGVASYAAALLCKESALALPVLAAALDVFVHRRDWRAVIRRLAPLVLVTLAYLLLRGAATDVLVAGGERRLPKMVMMGGALAALVVIARAGGLHALVRPAARRPVAVTLTLTAAAGVLMALALVWPPASAWMREKLGFVAYAIYYLVSPVVTWSPPQAWFEPAKAIDAVPGLVLLLGVLASVTVALARVRDPDRLGFVVAFILGSLLPVSSMTGGTRYLYLASAGIAWAGAWIFQSLSMTRWRVAVSGALAVLCVLSITQISSKGRDWQWASAMTRDGLAAMSADLQPCGTRHLLLLTAPVGIRGVYGNFYWEAFDVAHGCAPASFRTLLRLVGREARVEVRVADPGLIEIRIPDYAGQVVASNDLSHFDRPVGRGDSGAIDTVLGRLTFGPEGPGSDVEVFRLAPTPEARAARLFFYGRGGVHTVGAGR